MLSVRWPLIERVTMASIFAADDYRRAQTELGRHQVEVDEIKRGLRNATPPENTFGDLCDYWLEKRAPGKRSEKTPSASFCDPPRELAWDRRGDHSREKPAMGLSSWNHFGIRRGFPTREKVRPPPA